MAGILVGVLLSVPVLLDLDDHGTPEPPQLIDLDPAAADAFLHAWERSRTTTWVVESTFTRTLEGGPRLTAEARTAQRPPERLVVGLGAVSGRDGDERFACAAGEDGELECRRVEANRSYAGDVAQELRRLEALVTERGDELALYAVRGADEGCFELRLRFRFPAPPYGERATFCFDEETGAPVRTVIEREEGTDTTVADDVRARVTDADLQPPERVDVPTPG